MVNVPRKTAFFTVLLTAGLALAVLFAGVFVIAEYDHTHIDAAGDRVPAGEDCRICLEIQIALRLIEAFARLGASFFFAGCVLAVMPLIKPQTFLCAINPFVLKVKLNC